MNLSNSDFITTIATSAIGAVIAVLAIRLIDWSAPWIGRRSKEAMNAHTTTLKRLMQASIRQAAHVFVIAYLLVQIRTLLTPAESTLTRGDAAALSFWIAALVVYLAVLLIDRRLLPSRLE